MDSPSHCSSCGQIKLDVDVERLIFSNPTIEFDEAIAQVDIRIRELFEVRAALCRQSNQTRSHVYRLPPETLSLIFQEVCAPPLENWEDAGKVNYHAIILSSVSSYWLQVALGTARMWNEMAFGVREGAMKSAADLFQHHTRHAKDLDLSVSVFFEGCSRDSEGPSDRDASDHQALENILFSDEVAQRIITLYLVGVPLKWGSTQRHWGLPRVHTMYISGAQDAPIVSRYQVLDTPCLHRLHVAGESWDLLVIPPTLRTLVLSGTLPGTNVDLPSQCPDLIECYNRVPYSPDPDIRDEYDVPYTWNQLKSLTWSIHEGLTAVRSVRNMKLPALEHLCLLDVLNIPNFNAVITFVHQTSATLTTLELQAFVNFGWKREEGHLARMFRHDFPNLRTLKLTHWILGNMFEAIRVLTPTEEEYYRGEVAPFPKLMSLILDGDGGCSAKKESQFFRAVLRMLKRRRVGEHVSFQIQLPDLVGDWRPEVEEEYEQVLGHRKINISRGLETWACFGL